MIVTMCHIWDKMEFGAIFKSEGILIKTRSFRVSIDIVVWTKTKSKEAFVVGYQINKNVNYLGWKLNAKIASMITFKWYKYLNLNTIFWSINKTEIYLSWLKIATPNYASRPFSWHLMRLIAFIWVPTDSTFSSKILVLCLEIIIYNLVSRCKK